MALAMGDLVLQPIAGWHVRRGELWVELPDRGAVVACDCGHPHLLPSEVPGRLRTTCHACGRRAEVALAQQAFSPPRA